MKETKETEAVGGGKIIHLDEAQLRDHLDRKITESVEQTLKKLLDAEAGALFAGGQPLRAFCGPAGYTSRPL